MVSKSLSIILWVYFIGFGISLILGIKGDEIVLLKTILVGIVAGFLYIGGLINGKR